jgi:glycosyltransferase involved in cell wall biosynthesis
MVIERKIQLTAIIPIRSMVGKLDNLRITLSSCAGLPIQIVIVHDDASDGTEEDLNQLLEDFDDLNIEKIQVQCESPGLARNLGIKLAKADWICFWDSDDLPDPTAFMSILNSINLECYDVLIGAIATQSGFDFLTQKTHPFLVAGDSLQMQLANMPAFTRMIFRKVLIGEHLFPAFKIGEDQCFLRKIEFLNARVFYSEELLYVYISDFDGQLSRRQNLASELALTLEFLASELDNSPLQMQIFCQAQFLKIFISSCRNEGWIQTLLASPKAFRAAIKLVLRHPRTATKIFLFLAQNRPQLAGRE